MNHSSYLQLFDEILGAAEPAPPYDDPAYLDYTRLNQSRMKRWEQTMVLDPDLVEQIQHIETPQQWIIITEPWCGDAAHIVPFLVRMAQLNPLIELDLQLRDAPPFLIESYLTGSSKSIPKLIVRDSQGKDLWVWGPRPEGAQKLMQTLQEDKADFETIKRDLQHWYNQDRGQSLFTEIKELLDTHP